MKHLMKHSHIILFLTAVILSFKGIPAVDNLTSQELLEAQKKGVIIIDIRTPEEWIEQGTISEVSKIMFFDQKRQPLVNEFMAEFQKLVTSKNQAFVLVCRTGSRTGVVTKYLDEKLGYSKASHLEKGMKQWLKDKHPVEINNGH